MIRSLYVLDEQWLNSSNQSVHCLQDKRIAHLPYHALSPTERDVYNLRRSVQNHLADIMRTKVTQSIEKLHVNLNDSQPCLQTGKINYHKTASICAEEKALEYRKMKSCFVKSEINGSNCNVNLVVNEENVLNNFSVSQYRWHSEHSFDKQHKIKVNDVNLSSIKDKQPNDVTAANINKTDGEVVRSEGKSETSQHSSSRDDHRSASHLSGFVEACSCCFDCSFISPICN